MELKKYKLGELFSIKQGFAFKSEKYLRKSPYRLCTLGNIDESNCFKFNDAKANYYSDDFPKDFVLNEGDLIIPLTEQTMGLFGNSAFIPKTDDYKFVLNQRVGKILYNASLIDKYYLHYLLATNNVRRQIEATATGTTQRNTSPDKISNVEVLIPNIDIQIKIGNFLYDIESKIVLNRRMNAKLEQMAKRFYDHWFVQFDFPNADGKPYKASGGKMIWNETLKRKIPAGWNVEYLENCVQTIIDHRGLTPKKLGGDWVEHGIIALSAKIVKDNKLINLDEANQVSEEMYKKWMTEELAKGDILMTSEAPLGEFFFLVGKTKYCLSQRLFAIRANPKKILPSYLFNELSHGNGYSQIQGKQSGSTVFGIRQEELRKVLVLIPEMTIQQQYENLAVNIYSRIRKNDEENITLIKLRDYLLPLLMNGQVEVK